MKKFLLFFFSVTFFLPANIFAQENSITAPAGGIPGACGYGANIKNPSPLDGSGSLGQSFNQSACGLNYVAATHRVETRYDPYTTTGTYGCGLPCTWSITGLPPCITVIKALVWANVSYTSGPPIGTISITNPLGNTFSYAAGAIGTSVSKCWGEAGTAGYRWDVTSCIANNGGYTFNFSGFNNPTWEIDGATIFIVYQDLSATYQGSLIFWDGAIANNNGGAVSQTLTGFSVCNTPNLSEAFMITSDHQDNIGASHNSTMNGVSYSFPNSFSNFQQVTTTLTVGQTTSLFGDNGGGADCYLWTMSGLYYQTTNCVTCSPQGLAATPSSTPAACGQSNGTATVNITGGIGPYTYVWNPAVAGNTNTANGLPAGSYQVTINDAVGCSSVITVVVSGTPGPSVSATSTPAGCTVANGTATANPSGGTPGYTYAWSSGGTGPTESNLSAGTYVVTVTDANGCTAQTSVVVSGTNAPTVSTTTTPTGCTVANGSATANPSGGTPGYTYSWSSGGTGQTEPNLPAGTYTVTVTDANGCVVTDIVTISPTSAPTTTSTVNSNVLCNGGSTGSATTNPTGGTPGYTYSWSPSGGNAQTATGLTAGTYVITITDANGCTTTDNITITEPTVITLTSNTTPVSCNGGNDGSATVNSTGGTPGYTYAWSPSGGNAQTANNLTAGSYQCTVTDANGCTTITSVVITQPSPLTASTSSVNVLCNGGNTGSATATMNGGSAPYTYAWNTIPVQNTQTATNLSAGTYQCTITDANGCTAVTSVTITQPAPLTLALTCGDSICAGDTTTLTAAAAGGNPAYTYNWLPNNQSGSSIQVSPSSSTNYTVSVVDGNGCSSSAAQTCMVTVLPAPTALFDTASTGGILGSVWSFSDFSSGGTSWYWIFDDPGSGTTNTSTQQNPIHNFSGAGTYTVTQVVFNQYGCPDTFKIVIDITEGILIPNVFTPDGNGSNDVWYIPNSGMKEFHVEIYDRWGLKVFETTADEIRWDGRSTAGKLLSDGTYYFVLRAILKSGTGVKNYSTQGYVTLLTTGKK